MTLVFIQMEERLTSETPLTIIERLRFTVNLDAQFDFINGPPV